MSSLSTFVETFVQFNTKQMGGSEGSRGSNGSESASFGSVLMKGGNPDQGHLGVPLGLHRSDGGNAQQVGGEDVLITIDPISTSLPDDVFDRLIEKMS